MATPQTKMFAYVLPMSKKLIDRMFAENKTVLTKFLHRQKIGLGFQPRTKVVFYETGGSKTLVAEASVLEAKMLLHEEVHKIHGNSVLLTKDELRIYVNRFPGRENKPLLVIVINKPKRYPFIIEWKKPMTMIGYVLDAEEYAHIIGKI